MPIALRTRSARLLKHDHRQVAHDVERGNHDDQEQDQAHGRLLEVQCLIERLVLLLPIDRLKPGTKPLDESGREQDRLRPIVYSHVDTAHSAPQPGELLRHRERDVHERVVVVVQAGLENPGYLEPNRGRVQLPGDRVDSSKTHERDAIAHRGVEVGGNQFTQGDAVLPSALREGSH
jgi:hypothetical protein